MRLRHNLTVGFALVLASAITGCGGANVPQEEAAALTDFDKRPAPVPPAPPTPRPIVLDLASPQSFTVFGTKFGPIGQQGTVIFTATTGTPFVGGTLASIEVAGTIVSETEIEGTIRLPGVANEEPVDVHVRLPDGSQTAPLTSTVRLMDSSLLPPVVVGPARFLDVNGDGVAGAGDELVMTFDREVVVDAADTNDFELHAVQNGFGSGATVEQGAEPDEVRIVLGTGVSLKTRHEFDSTRTAAGLELTDAGAMSGHITNVAGTRAEASGVRDVVPSFAQGQTLGSGDTRDVVLADVTGDGWPDAVAVDFLGGHVWYENDGAGNLGARQVLEITEVIKVENEPDDIVVVIAEFAVAVAAGDIDNDGDIDLVLGRTGGGNWVLSNEGGGVWRKIASLGLADTRDIALGDLDRDGDLDIVFANAGGGSRIWRNNLSSGKDFDEAASRLDKEFVSEAVALADLDRDGGLDIVLGNVGAPNTVWRNDTPKGGEIDFKSSAALMGSARTFDIAVGDVDRDGDLDLVAANHEAPAQVWLNDPAQSDTSGWFAAGAALGTATDDARNVVLDDTDGDGDLDVVLGTAFAGTTVWLNDGAGAFADSGERFGSDRVRGLVCGDLDHDGDQDLLTGNAGAADQVWESSLSGTWGTATFAQDPSTVAPDWTAAIAVWGLAGDSTVDRVAVGNAAGCNELWSAMNGVLEFDRRLGTKAVRDIALGDLDGDDEPEAVVCHADGIEIHHSDGITVTDLVVGNVTYHGVHLADLDGVNGLELVAVRDDAVEIWVALVLTQTLTKPNATFHAATAADLGGDGDLDLIVGSSDGVNIWVNGAGTFATNPDGPPLDAGSVHSVIAFNVDGDLFGVLPKAANAAVDVAAVATDNKFTRATDWDQLPDVGQAIVVSGFADDANNGPFTVVSRTAREIVVSGGTLVDEAAGPATTIEWIGAANTPINDIVAATDDAVVYWRNTLATAGNVPTFDAPITRGSPDTTGVAAGPSASGTVITASRKTGVRFWTGAALAQQPDCPGPYAGDIAAGQLATASSVFVAQSGAGHAVSGVAVCPLANWFASAKDTALLRDFDRDGDLDLVITESTGENRLWLWDAANGVFDNSNTTFGHGFATAADVDVDGDLDLMTADTPDGNGLRIWENDGTGNFTEGEEFFPADNVRGARFADLDRDGCPEIVAMTGTAVKILEDPKAADTDTDVGAEATGNRFTHATGWEQIPDAGEIIRVRGFVGAANNGVFTVVSANATMIVVSGGALVDEPEAGTAAEDLPSVTIGWAGYQLRPISPLPRAVDVAIGDMDGDGLPDLALVTAEGIEIFKNDGADFSFVKLVPLPDARAVALGDLDRDGDLDLVAGGRDQPISFWLNPGDGTFDTAQMVADNPWTEALSLRDVDGDGDLDLFVGTFGGDNQLFRYDASNDMFAPATPTLGGFWTNALAVGDTDRDGDPDLVTRDKESTDDPAPRENE